MFTFTLLKLTAKKYRFSPCSSFASSLGDFKIDFVGDGNDEDDRTTSSSSLLSCLRGCGDLHGDRRTVLPAEVDGCGSAAGTKVVVRSRSCCTFTCFSTLSVSLLWSSLSFTRKLGTCSLVTFDVDSVSSLRKLGIFGFDLSFGLQLGTSMSDRFDELLDDISSSSFDLSFSLVGV